MITSYEVGAIFRIIDQASPVLKEILKQVRALNAAINKARENLASLNKVMVPQGMAGAVDQTRALAIAWREVAAQSQAATRAIGQAGTAARRALPPPGRLPTAAGVGGIAAAGAGGRGGGGGRHRPGWLGGAHFSSPGIGLPGGSHVHFRGGLSGGAAATAGLLGYAAYEDAQMQDAVFQLIYHSGQQQNAQNRNRFRKIIQDSMAESGYSLHDVVEAAKQEVRMFQGTPGGGLDVLPEMLRASTIESRLKGESPEESMKALIGLAHMTKQYSPDQIKKLAPAFAFLSTANPGSLGSIEKAAGYAVPLLQSGLDIDPMQTLLLGTALTRAGATSTKSGTWLRQMATRAMPGSALMSSKMFEKHEDALHRLGLVDESGKPTWFKDGKPDLLKMLDMAGKNAPNIPLTDRAALELQLFGAQGGGGFALLSDPAVRQQVQSLRNELNSTEFKNRYGSFTEAYAAGSPVQQSRKALADFNIAMMNLGTKVLPAVSGALSDFDKVLQGIRSILPGADKDGKGGGDKWKVGTRAIEGMALGAGLGTIVPGLGTVAGGIAGGAAGGLYGVVEGLVKSSSEAVKPVDRFGREVINTGNAASSSAGAMKALGDAIRSLPGAAPGGVFPGGASRTNFLSGPKRAQPVVVHTALQLDGRTLARSTSKHLAEYFNYPTQAPFHDGRQTWSPPDMQVITT